jgi:hypothetical protein
MARIERPTALVISSRTQTPIVSLAFTAFQRLAGGGAGSDVCRTATESGINGHIPSTAGSYNAGADEQLLVSADQVLASPKAISITWNAADLTSLERRQAQSQHRPLDFRPLADDPHLALALFDAINFYDPSWANNGFQFEALRWLQLR